MNGYVGSNAEKWEGTICQGERDRPDNCMQAGSLERSASLSSNTHSAMASSHYDPPGAKLHLPHTPTAVHRLPSGRALTL